MTTLKPLPTDLGTGTFQVEFQALIKVLGENLYSNPRACVRELIQNANDSCVRRQSAGQSFQPAIQVTANTTKRTLIFEDNGAGMVQEDVVRYLASIGGGRTREERARLSTEDKAAANMLIGQFGIGFLSSFVVADRVVVDTLSIEGGDPVRWICEGTSEYQIGRGNRSTPGTRVTLSLKRAHYDLLEDETLYNTIIYYADFIAYPILLNGRTEPINRMHAPWHGKGTDREFVAYIQHRYDVEPLAMMPISVERKNLSAQGVLFVPPRSGEWKRHLRSIDVFQKRMFIGEDMNILPEWAGFISGVIDCATLDLVASRESAISERPSYQALQEYLGEAVTSFVKNLAKQNRSLFLEVIKQHEWAVKWGAIRNDFFFEQVKDLIPIASDMGQLTIPRYLQRVPRRLGGLRTIYYVPGQQSVGQQQSSIFRARGVPILRTDTVDEQFLKKYVERDRGVNLRQMVSGVIELMEFVEGDTWRKLEARYEQMGIHARGVRFHPPDMPALAVRNPESEPDSMIGQMLDGKGALFDMIGRIGKNTSDMYSMCFNVDNPIIQRLATYQGDPTILEAALRSIHSSALLAAGVELTTELSQAVAQSEMRVIELLLEQDQRLHGKGKAKSGYGPSMLNKKIPATRYSAASFGEGSSDTPMPDLPAPEPEPAAQEEPQRKRKKLSPDEPYERPFKYDPNDPWFPARQLEYGEKATRQENDPYDRPYREEIDQMRFSPRAYGEEQPRAEGDDPATAPTTNDPLQSRSYGETLQPPGEQQSPPPEQRPEGESARKETDDPYERPFKRPVHAPWPDTVSPNTARIQQNRQYERPFRAPQYQKKIAQQQRQNQSLINRLFRRKKK